MNTFIALAASFLVATTSAFAHENGTIKIYNSQLSFNINNPGKLLIDDDKKVERKIPPKALILNENLKKIRDYFYINHNRRSWDDRSSDIVATINVGSRVLDVMGRNENAYWLSEQKRMIFGVGDKDGLHDIEQAIDIVGHEYVHAIVETTSRLTYSGQSGALNEHFADVFGSIINQTVNTPLKPYLIGYSALHGSRVIHAVALRDMMFPSLSLTPQPASMRDLNTVPQYEKYREGCVPSLTNDACGVHVLSGIPNRAAALMMSKLDLKDVANIYYSVMTKRLKWNAKFADYRNALLEECKSYSAQTCVVVEESLNAVGI